jgi:hypothetical protein
MSDANEKTVALRAAQKHMDDRLTTLVATFERETGLAVVDLSVERASTMGGLKNGGLIAVYTEVRL